ncbi:mammalian cell entry protein [Mycolicibacter heraklionensis]|uniref:Mammalian cell entry protein n=1 Tax=Mycolicibacter heraklionensis TaxID=512402 RepID=A0ABR5FBG3_9MYCO|nr:MlaD family protein [Mycolicibacter heraklionensis]KLO26610.1 mammalian cell entry protein [Mycolicibacter heraklionensis]
MNVVEPIAALILRTVRSGVAHRLLISGLAQIALVVVGVTYLLFGALRDNPFADQITVAVHLDESGGLLANQDVTLRGVPIGRVASVDFTGDGVRAIARIDARAKIPRDGTIARVSGLSPAGEQYLNFEPTDTTGPPLTDGAVIDRANTAAPIPIWRLLGNVDGLLAQTDPVQLKAVLDELAVSEQGPEKLRQLLTGSQLLISTLDGVLPQTMTLLRSSRPLFKIFDDSSNGMRSIASNLGATLAGVSDKDAGMRRMLDETPKVLATVDQVIADNSETAVQLLGNLTTVAQLSYVRVPALQQLFRDDRPPLLDGVASLMHGGGIWAIADIYPRYMCDYSHPRDVPFIPNYPEPYLNTYCLNDDPGLLIRGARNAPRPPGDDTANPPPGWDPLRRTDPTPVGPHTIPLPYGGPAMPPESEPHRQGIPWN